MEALEDQLREAASFGDRETVEKLLETSVNINAKNKVNGWTALHWACKRGHSDIVNILLSRGADTRILNEVNETPAQVCTNPVILDELKQSEIFWNYHPNNHVALNSESSSRPRYKHSGISNMPTTMLPSVQDDGIVLKIRMCGNNDPDFIEIEIPKWKLTYINLLKVCCEELQCSEDQVERIRKLPNTRLRNDNDTRRLTDYHELELVMKGPPGSDKPTNCYQSISTCKDQTILY